MLPILKRWLVWKSIYNQFLLLLLSVNEFILREPSLSPNLLGWKWHILNSNWLKERSNFCGKVKNCLSPVVCFRGDMVQGLNWCHEDLVSLHFSALPLATLASFPGFLWWPWNLQAQILFPANRPMGKHDAFLSLVPGKASLTLIRLWAHSPSHLLGLENAAFWSTKPELISVLRLQPLKEGPLRDWSRINPSQSTWTKT